MTDKFRINGDTSQRIELENEFNSEGKAHSFAVWRVEIMGDNSEWHLVTACVGPMSYKSAQMLLKAYQQEN